MKLYFSTSQIPEMAGLTRAQRKAVFQCGLEAFYHEQPSRVLLGAPWIGGGFLGGFLVGVAVIAGAGVSHSRWLILLACGLVGAVIGTFVGGQIQTAQLRPYFRRVLEERKDEIARIN